MGCHAGNLWLVTATYSAVMLAHAGRMLVMHHLKRPSSVHGMGSLDTQQTPAAEDALLAREFLTILQAREALRQQRETFEINKLINHRWERVRLMMAYTALILMPIISLACIWAIVHHKDFSNEIVTLSTGALLTHSLGLILWVWRNAFSKHTGGLTVVTEIPFTSKDDLAGIEPLAGVTEHCPHRQISCTHRGSS
jgi:hypothetical protein